MNNLRIAARIRVDLTIDLDSIYIPEGSEGWVQDVDPDGTVWIRLERYFHCLNEWNNCLPLMIGAEDADGLVESIVEIKRDNSHRRLRSRAFAIGVPQGTVKVLGSIPLLVVPVLFSTVAEAASHAIPALATLPGMLFTWGSVFVKACFSMTQL